MVDMYWEERIECQNWALAHCAERGVRPAFNNVLYRAQKRRCSPWRTERRRQQEKNGTYTYSGQQDNIIFNSIPKLNRLYVRLWYIVQTYIDRHSTAYVSMIKNEYTCACISPPCTLHDGTWQTRSQLSHLDSFIRQRLLGRHTSYWSSSHFAVSSSSSTSCQATSCVSLHSDEATRREQHGIQLPSQTKPADLPTLRLLKTRCRMSPQLLGHLVSSLSHRPQTMCPHTRSQANPAPTHHYCYYHSLSLYVSQPQSSIILITSTKKEISPLITSTAYTWNETYDNGYFHTVHGRPPRIRKYPPTSIMITWINGTSIVIQHWSNWHILFLLKMTSKR